MHPKACARYDSDHDDPVAKRPLCVSWTSDAYPDFRDGTVVHSWGISHRVDGINGVMRYAGYMRDDL